MGALEGRVGLWDELLRRRVGYRGPWNGVPEDSKANLRVPYGADKGGAAAGLSSGCGKQHDGALKTMPVGSIPRHEAAGAVLLSQDPSVEVVLTESDYTLKMWPHKFKAVYTVSLA